MASEVQQSNKLTLTPRQKKLCLIIIIGSFFEGFDDALINIALPYIQADFGVTTQQVSFSLSLIGLGTMFAFFLVRLADKFGRRPLLLTSIVCYTLCSFITAFSQNLTFLVFWQFVARIFLIGCWSLSYIIVAEEFEANQRGKASSILQAIAVSGALMLSLLLPVFTALNIGWRGMYIVGALPLIPVVIFQKWLPETQMFLDAKAKREAGIAEEKPEEKQDFFEVWKPKYRRNMLIMSISWVLLYFGVKGSLNFYSLHMVNDLGWTPGMITIGMASMTIVGMVIIVLNGKLIDKIGRKKGAVVILTVGAISAAAVFLAKNFIVILIVGCIAGGFTNSFLMVASTITNELFPTEVRANAMAWSNNIVGRLGQVLVPSVVGLLSIYLGLAYSVAIVVMMPIIAAMLIWFLLPETKSEEQ